MREHPNVTPNTLAQTNPVIKIVVAITGRTIHFYGRNIRPGSGLEQEAFLSHCFIKLSIAL